MASNGLTDALHEESLTWAFDAVHTAAMHKDKKKRMVCRMLSSIEWTATFISMQAAICGFYM